MQARWSAICMDQLQKFMGSDEAATFQQRRVEEAIITLLGAAADPQDMNDTMIIFHRFLSPVPSSSHIADVKLEPGTLGVLQKLKEVCDLKCTPGAAQARSNMVHELKGNPHSIISPFMSLSSGIRFFKGLVAHIN